MIRASALALPLTTLLFAGVGLSQPQDAKVKPDQVFTLTKSGAVKTQTGIVTENGLEKLVLDQGGKDKKFDNDEVQRIVWGSVPQAYKDGTTYLRRSDFENASAKFKQVAADESVRAPIRAEARLRAARSFVGWGSVDAAHFTTAAEEAEKFLSEHPANRGLPQARELKARATWLGGDPQAAGELFKALFESGAGETPTPGYDPLMCAGAGLSSARAFLDAGDTLGARTAYDGLARMIEQASATLEEGDARKSAFADLSTRSALGEGFVLLASDQADDAIRFFESKALGESAVGASLGLGKALLAADRPREAQIQFAKVSALETKDRDALGDALVGLADCALKLNDPGSKALIESWCTQVRESFGDTPSAARANEILATL